MEVLSLAMVRGPGFEPGQAYASGDPIRNR